MKLAATEHDQMMAEIMEFTMTVVAVAEIRDIDAVVKAKAIYMAEQIFHKMIMNKMLAKCVEKVTPCNN